MERRHAALAMRWVILLLGLLLAAWTLVDHKSARCDRDVSATGTTARTRPPVDMVRASAGPDLGGHGARPSQLVAAAARTATIDDDPWASPEDAKHDRSRPSATSSAAAKVRRILRLVITSKGEHDHRREPLPQDDDALRELIAYDVSALVTRADGCAAPLEGCEATYEFSTGCSGGGSMVVIPSSAVVLGLHAIAYESDAARGRAASGLLDALMTATGVEAWTTNDTWLGLDDERSLLWLRNTPRVAATVEQVLDRWAAQAASLWRIRARIEGNGMARQSLDLDVLWAGAARAFTGTRSTFLMDYDVEVGQGWSTVTPIWYALEAGLGLRALHLEPAGRGQGQIVLDLFDALGTPKRRTLRLPAYTFEPFTAFGFTTVEDLTLAAQHQQAALPANEDGRVAFGLSDGRRCVIEVRRIDGPITHWRRTRTPRAARPDLPAYCFELRGSRSGLLGQDHTRLGGGRSKGYAHLRAEDPAWIRKRQGSLERLGVHPDFYEPAHCGRIDVDIVAWDSASSPSRLDLVLDVEAWSGHSRLLRRPWREDKRGARWTESELPTADAVVVSRRLLLDRHGTGAMAFQGDIGLGPERFTLRVWRRDSGRAPPSTR